jgi:heat-inducible transcriptional repressor
MNLDDEHLPALTRRQEEILALIVRAYTQSAKPVSSKQLVDDSALDVSSATIRNEMGVLEELGYITMPHTSAGRVPTQSGYRYFVRRLIDEGALESAEQARIQDKLGSLPLATEQWLRQSATLLARTAQTAALVTPPMAGATSVDGAGVTRRRGASADVDAGGVGFARAPERSGGAAERNLR